MATPVNRNIFYKYEAMRTKWSRCFEDVNPRASGTIKTFFNTFHKNHRGFTFVEGELFDETIYLLVSPDQYNQIKEEIEKKVGETLPDVSKSRDVTIKDSGKSFPNLQSFRNYSSTLNKQNKEVEKRRKEEARKNVDELQRTIGKNPKALILSFDLEAYEHDHSIILEIGYAMTTLDNQEDVQTFHYIIQENLSYSNKDYVPDKREQFKFGKSQHMPLKEAAARLREHIQGAHFLVTHSGAHDTEFLESCGVSVFGKLMFDTQVLSLALLPDGPKVYGLKKLLEDLKIDFDEDVLHNGGNDAFYTLKVFLSLVAKLDLA